MFKLLRTGECWRTNKSVMCQRLWIRRGVNCLCQTEVDYFHQQFFVVASFPIGRDEHQICRLQVAMDQSALFRSGQCRGDLLCNADGGTRLERSGMANTFINSLALDQFHRVKILPCLEAHSELVNGSDVFVSQCSSRTGFAHEAFARV